MKGAAKTISQPHIKFGKALAIEQLIGLTAELQNLRTHPPLVRRSDGKYEGDILGFVKGLRLSARIIYFLREHLSGTDLEVSWGHLIDENDESCSPECDVIVHAKGHVRKWNGQHDHPIMDFRFIRAESTRAVISCKSSLNSVDRIYPKALRSYGVQNIFLFAECCEDRRFLSLRKKAESAGYSGLWCLYLTQDSGTPFKTDESMYDEFGKAVLKAVRR